MRKFKGGATRNNDIGKLDYEAFLHPSVLEVYCTYMNKHRVQADGKLREGDNWQKGIPQSVYIKSLFRHFVDLWKLHRGIKVKRERKIVNVKDSCAAIMFNVMGYLYEELKT